MLYTVYKTTNLVNGKFYIGVHKTKNPDDGYLGSGKYIKAAIAKHGESKFKKEILFSYSDADPAFEKEAELVGVYRDDRLCMNLREGGSGGFDYVNRNNLHSTKEGRERLKQILRDDPEFLKRAVKKRDTPEWRKVIRDGVLNSGTLGKAWLGRKHLSRTKQKMSETAKRQNRTGERNPQYGTLWIKRDEQERKIKAAELDGYLTDGWQRGRKGRGLQ